MFFVDSRTSWIDRSVFNNLLNTKHLQSLWFGDEIMVVFYFSFSPEFSKLLLCCL